MDIRALDRRAVESTGTVIDKLTDEQLDLPTPCDKWTVREVIGHLVDNNHNLVARVTGLPKREAGEDPRRDYRVAAAALTGAFVDDAALEVSFEMAVIGRSVNGATALSVHFADVLVHGWDLARAIGVDIALDPELVEAALTIVGRYPDTGELWAEGGTIFAPRVPVPDDADPRRRLLAMTGRSLDWNPGVTRAGRVRGLPRARPALGPCESPGVGD
ncbi:TIGR03086 family metal-binding protein [Actinokineospora sp. 24-640]